MTDIDTETWNPGDRCGRYTIERVLGTGGMGVVYLARDEAGRQRALKTLVFGGKLKEAVVERFKREILLLASIEHVNVVRFYEAGKVERPSGTTMWLSLEFLEGQTLREIIDARRDGVEPENVARWGRHIADGVGAAHRIHVVHRDLKPENAALKGELVKVFDLGIAKWRGAMNATAANLRMGTLAYMAPEQIDPSIGEIDERTDIYALGLILYELATGKHPLVPLDEPIPPSEAQMRLLMADVKPIRAARPDFPSDLEAIVLRCLQRDKAARYASMRDMSDELEQVLLRLRSARHAEAFKDLGVGSVDGSAPTDVLKKAKTGSGSDVTPPPVVHSDHPSGSGSGGYPATVRMSTQDALAAEVGPARAAQMIAAAQHNPAGAMALAQQGAAPQMTGPLPAGYPPTPVPGATPAAAGTPSYPGTTPVPGAVPFVPGASGQMPLAAGLPAPPKAKAYAHPGVIAGVMVLALAAGVGLVAL
ncbi:MAG: protein kinase, partial [Myxococcota bacterium]